MNDRQFDEHTGDVPEHAMTSEPVSGRRTPPSADPERISRRLAELAAISETTGEDGVTRLAYTPREREAHNLFRSWMDELGLTVQTDAVGNTVAERPGRHSGPAVGTGSHLDSVPQAGRFDGIVGVVAAVEAAELLSASDVEHDHPFRFVAFAAEEGARFGQACIGSKAAGGLWNPADLKRFHDADGVVLADAMAALGFCADDVDDARWTPEQWGAFVELHVEQGAVLERDDLPIGVVDLISGSTRFELTITGTASHTGSTPMDLRHDALAAAAEIVLLAEEVANDARHRGTRCTVGRLSVRPGSLTTIPGEVVLAVDVRDVDSGRQRETANEIVHRARRVCERRGVDLQPHLLSDASPVVLPVWIREVTAGVCRELDVPYRVMYSGASHDTQMVNQAVSAGLIFVPSRGGLSHVPSEWSSASDIATGVDVLLRTMLALDDGASANRTEPADES